MSVVGAKRNESRTHQDAVGSLGAQVMIGRGTFRVEAAKAATSVPAEGALELLAASQSLLQVFQVIPCIEIDLRGPNCTELVNEGFLATLYPKWSIDRANFLPELFGTRGLSAESTVLGEEICAIALNGIDLVVWSVPIKQVLALFLDSASSVELEISF